MKPPERRLTMTEVADLLGEQGTDRTRRVRRQLQAIEERRGVTLLQRDSETAPWWTTKSLLREAFPTATPDPTELLDLHDAVDSLTVELREQRRLIDDLLAQFSKANRPR